MALAKRLKKDGLPLCVVTATPRELAQKRSILFVVQQTDLIVKNLQIAVDRGDLLGAFHYVAAL